jgi:DNA modification methylase
MTVELRVINISQIEVGDRFREEFGDIDTLAASIKKEGIISPLAVSCTAEEGKYVLLAGGRRHKACTQAGVVDIPVRIYPASISELEMRSIELMENVCRKDLSWVEASNLKKEIHELQVAIHGSKTSTSPGAEGWSKRDTANLLGKSVGGVIDDINLAKALEVFPQLKDAKTKGDATKLFKKLQEQMVVSEIAKRAASKTANTPIEAIHHNLISSYIVRDFFEGVSKLPDRSIDVIEIDPPYSIGLGTSTIKRSDDSLQTNTKDYNEVPVDQYVPFLNSLFKECYRTMSENSWIICWFAQEPWFEIVYQAMARVGFKGSRIPAIWQKEAFSGQTNHPECYLANCYEPFFYARKGSPTISKQGRSNIYKYKPVNSQSKIHPTERPIELIQDVLQTFAWEGCRVMVPFLGSGNTLLAASNLGLSAFGFDLSEEYKNAYTVRVVEGRPQQYKSYREVIADVQ